MAKDFSENIDKQSINQEVIPFDAPQQPRTFRQKLWQWISRHILLVLVALAALSITFLHFQGKALLQVLQGTPLPRFLLDVNLQPKPLPDKIQIYEEALQAEEKEAWQKKKETYTRPNWQGYFKQDTVAHPTKSKAIAKDTLQEEVAAMQVAKPKAHKPALHKKAKMKKQKIMTRDTSVQDLNFFQPVRASVPASSPAAFIPCVVHGDQQVVNNSMLTLRLQKAVTINGRHIPAHTLLYGKVRLAQNRLQVSVQRILQEPVAFAVHDYTYHEGILLEEREEVLQEAAQETAYRQGYRSVGLLPVEVAAELGRNLLQQAKRKEKAVFLPDGYSLFIVNQHKPQ